MIPWNLYYFWSSKVHQKYVVWVHVGCGINFRIQQALLIEIWVKTQGDMSKIRTKKVVLLWKICQFNHYGWLILLKFYWFLNSNSQELIVGVFSYKAHFRPQISSNGYFGKSENLCLYPFTIVDTKHTFIKPKSFISILTRIMSQYIMSNKDPSN